jgi:AraC-like DNA-binding protein
MDVGEIALDLGFMTPENFIHYFKDKYGSLPLEYRLRHKKDL